jgi:hypothetical protein
LTVASQGAASRLMALANHVQPIADVAEYLDKRRKQPDPNAEPSLWVTIPDTEKEEVTELLSAFRRVRERLSDMSVTRACADVLAQPRFSRRHWKLNTFRQLYDRFTKAQDWVIVVNKSKCKAAWRSTLVGLPEKFLAFIAREYEPLKRETSRQKFLAALKRQWRSGRNERGEEEPIPGYEVLADGRHWKDRDRETIPSGWHESNISRCLRTANKRQELSAEFIQFWQMLCERHQRCTSNAHRQLLMIWRAKLPFQIGDEAYELIPGYSDWPAADPRTDVPPGWTESNLGRYTPDQYELAAARIGIQKAGALGFKIRTSRFGLKLGEFMEFDDHEFNVKVNFPGQLRAMRPRCFGAVDALTDCMFSMVIKPTLWDMEAEAKRVLNEKDFMWFIVAVLTHRGFRSDVGTMLLCEWGTSAIRGNQKLKINDPLRDDFEKRIWDCTGGAVRVDRGGRFRKQANPSQFAPPTGGNFRFKPHVEQFWRMLDDWLDALKGQTGKGRDFAPEEMERADAYNNKLLKAARTMGIEQASRLILPRMTFAEFTQTANTVMNLINDDPDHECNSWEQCGFILKEWRSAPSLNWNPLALLASASREVQLAVAQNDLLFRARRMTRAEADRKHQRELSPLPMMMIPQLVGPQFAGKRPVTVRGGKFELQDENEFCTSDPLVFVALDASGRPLTEGDKFTSYCNPMSPDALVICDASGAAVSVCPPDLQPARNDEHGVAVAMGVKNHWQAMKLAPQRARHQAAGAGVEFMKQHNEQVISGAATPEQKQRVRDLRKFTGDVADLAETAAETAAVPGQGDDDFSAEALL